MTVMRPVVLTRRVPGYEPVDYVGFLIWRDKAPFTVGLTVVDGLKPVPWEFDLDILIYGQDDTAGIADVVISPHDDETLTVVLSSPEGWIQFGVRRSAVAAFLAQVQPLVPAAVCSVDWDAAIADLLSEGSR